MVKLRIEGETVTLQAGVWSGASAGLQADLDALTAYAQAHPPRDGQYVPDPDIPLADLAVYLLGAEILDRIPPKLKKDAIA